MPTRLENLARRQENIDALEKQLERWSTLADEMVAGYLKAGALPNDPYRLRVDDLRTRVALVKSRLAAYREPDPVGAWGPFRATVAEDLKVLTAGFKDLAPESGGEAGVVSAR